MAPGRFVVLGLAQVRSSWFRDLARWSNSAMVPVEFLKAMSVEEVRARLRSGRSCSALIVDDGMPGIDRDLVDLATGAGCAVIVVTNDRSTRPWTELGASALLPAGFGRTELLQALGQVARPIERSDEAPTAGTDEARRPGFRGRLVTVIGPGGTGTSTVAMAIAQGLARDPRNADLVCLADLALNAEQALLHGSPDVVPGVVELVEAHRSGTPSLEEVRRLTWHVPDRGYHLLLGVRRHRDWTAIRPRAFDAALDALRRGFRVVVADADSDVEGESACGSLDVEERNSMARSSIGSADLVVVVGCPGVKGIHSMLRVIRETVQLGVPGDRVLPVVNQAPRGPRARSEIAAALGALLEASGERRVPSPLHLPERRRLDEVIREGQRLPDAWLGPIARAVMAIVDGEPTGGEAAARPERELVRVEPGTVGSWTDQEGDDGEDLG